MKKKLTVYTCNVTPCGPTLDYLFYRHVHTYKRKVHPLIHYHSLFVKVSTFQVALAYNNDSSFAFFFYDEVNVDSSQVNIGFSPSSFDTTGSSFMLPGVLNGSSGLDVAGGSNTGVPGFYAFRIDLDIIIQPQGVLS